jgi:uncharacterized membrane protein YphA (DoxX/SURF4 family)
MSSPTVRPQQDRVAMAPASAAAWHPYHYWPGPGPVIRSLTMLLLRVGLGIVFLHAGVSKFQDRAQGIYPGSLLADFDRTILGQYMPFAVRLFFDVLPYAEVGVGALLTLGLFTTFAAAASGVLLLHLLIGTLEQGDPSRIPSMLIYMLVNAAVLWLSQVCCNYISLDAVIFGLIFRAPEGEESLREVVAETREHLGHHPAPQLRVSPPVGVPGPPPGE